MKHNLLSLFILFVNFFACDQLISSKGNKNGGLLIVYNNTASITSLVLLETNLIIKPTNDRIAIICDLRPGIYSILVKDNTKG